MRAARAVPGRAAVAVAFLVNGAALSSCWPRLPQIRDAVAATNGELGLALAGTSVGAIAGTAAAGWLLRTLTTRAAITGAGVALTLSLTLPGTASTPLWLGLALAVAGWADGALDVAMNTAGVELERAHDRPLLNSLHAVWSLGSVAGAAAGALAAARGLSVAAHLTIVGAVLLTVVVASSRWLPTSTPRPADAAVVQHRHLRAAGVLGAAAVAAAVVESVPTDWSAIYARDVAGATPGAAAAAFTALTLAMILGRLAGDRLVACLGAGRVLVGGCGVAVTGVAVAATAGSPGSVIAGFGLVGAGAACAFPVLFAAAGNVPGMPPAAGIAIMSSLSRIGFLIAPPAVGGVAEVAGLRPAILCAAVAAVVLAVLSRRVTWG